MFPNASTTGVRAGVSLTTVNGTSTTSSDGQVIQGLDLDTLVINNDNVIVRDCRIGKVLVGNAQSNVVTGTTIEYCDIVGNDFINSVDIEGDNTTIRFCDISGSENGIWLEADRVLVEGNYIHNLFSNNGSPDPHIDGIQIPGFNIGAIQTNDIMIRGNNISLDNRTASASITMADGLNVDIVSNRLSGGSSVIYFEGNSSECDVVNNVFGEKAFSFYVAGASWEDQRYGGNIDEATGQPILGNDPLPPPPPPDTTPPAKPVIASFSTDTGTIGDGRTTDTTLVLTGMAEANSTITVFDGASTLGTASVGSGGAWTFATATLSLATHTFTAKAADAAGNISVASNSLAVTVEATAPPHQPSAVNDAPVNTVPGPQTVDEDTVLPITGLAVADVDAGSGRLTTTLSVLNGILEVDPGAGATVNGSGTDTVTLTGTLARINATLSAAGNVVYKSDTGFTGTDTLTMITDDGGNSGSGGPLTDVDVMSIEVRNRVNTNDFNGDGKSDILWRHDSGPLATWELDSGTIFHYHFLGGADPSYSVDAVADFDGNGTADVLRRHDSGFIITWDINHGHQTGYHAIGPTNPADVIEGTGDFNGDGRAELLWRNADTGVVTWQLNTGPFVDTDVSGDEIAFTRDFRLVTSDWKIAGIGDVNGDGNSDIFWRHDSGQLVSWEVDDGTIIGYHDYGQVGNDYHFAGTGDFNGDGKSGDVLWRHDSGQVVTWELDGGTQIGYHDLGVVTNDYKIEDTGDYNGDGRSDILWRHNSGQVITWELNGGSIVGDHSFGFIDPAWQIR